jgi:1,4-dihydroxy-2-naphthoate polyprenyltransferase
MRFWVRDSIRPRISRCPKGTPGVVLAGVDGVTVERMKSMSEHLAAGPARSRWRLWLAGIRPRTLPVAVVPVAVGTGAAAGVVDIIWWRAGAALVVALAIQIATNLVNDYADGKRGTDTVRVGPLRLVGSGLVPAAQVKRAAIVVFGVAAAVGAALALAVGPELLVVGLASMVAGWAYTGGPKPYGYLGLGELFVFVFFGLVATAGSTYVQTEQVTGLSLVASVPVGLLSVALLVVNNLRDIPTDARSGKKTLAVRIGDGATRRLYLGILVAVAIGVVACGVSRWPALLGLAGLAAAVAPARTVAGGATGPQLIPVLGATGRFQLLSGLGLALGLALGA